MVDDHSDAREKLRRRGRRTAWSNVLGGTALIIVGVGLLHGSLPAGARYLATLVLLAAVSYLFTGCSRFKVESSTPLTGPLILPALPEARSFVNTPEPRPAFGLRGAETSAVRSAAMIALMLAPIAAIGLLATDPVGPAVVGGAALIYLVVGVRRSSERLARSVRVAHGTIVWTTRRGRRGAPVSSMLRIRRSDVVSPVAVIEFDGYPSIELAAVWGFADFIDALTVTCPWVEVNSDVVKRLCAREGEPNLFFTQASEPETEADSARRAESG